LKIQTAKMKEALVAAGPKVSIHSDAPIPEPQPGQLVIKVAYCASNPKDWKIPEWYPDLPAMNAGNDTAGVVHSIGEGVSEFRVGDRVAAFQGFVGGGYAEYTWAWAQTTFRLPPKTCFAGMTGWGQPGR
jgi:NADPH2:quinone reductase